MIQTYLLLIKGNSNCLKSGFFALINFLLFASSAYTQTYNVNTSIASGIHNYTFPQAKSDSLSITVLAYNPFQSGSPCEFRLYDHQLNMIKRKQFYVTNDSLTQACGNGSTSFSTEAARIHSIPSDSSYIITTNFGHNYGTCQQLNGLVMMKLTNNFDTVWSRQISILSSGSIPFNDSTLLIYGSYASCNMNMNTGDTLWSRRSKYSLKGSMESYNDTTVYVLGSAFVTGLSTISGKLCELSVNANLIWDITVNDSTTGQKFYHGITTKDSCLVLLSVRNPNTQSQHMGLIKIDRQGNKLWEKIYTNPGYRVFPFSIIQTSDEGFLITYDAYDNIGSINKNLLLKTDSSGNPEWNRNFPGTNYACQYTNLRKIIKLDSEKLLIAGGNLIQTDTIGNGCFFTAFNNVSVSNGNSAVITNSISALPAIPPQQYINYNIRHNKFTFISTPDSSYLDSCVIFTQTGEPKANQPIKVYPNPGSDKIKIDNIECESHFTLRVYDLLGKEVYKVNVTGSEAIISIEDTGSGVFTLLIECDNQFYYSKITFLR